MVGQAPHYEDSYPLGITAPSEAAEPGVRRLSSSSGYQKTPSGSDPLSYRHRTAR